jgi:hypothetical protein
MTAFADLVLVPRCLGKRILQQKLLPAGFVTDGDRMTNPTKQESLPRDHICLASKPLSRAASRSF